MSTTDTPSRMQSARTSVQKFGTFLSNMIMPNIGAFIAWGLITALFIKVGWFPVPELGGFGTHMVDGKEVAWTGLVGPMITYLLPLLIGYTGGYNIYDKRGGVVGAIATMGVIVGTSIPMFIGAMIMGPLGGWSMKKLDSLWHHRIKPGFEMLVNNFSAGIWGGALAVIGFYLIGPVVTAFSAGAAAVVGFLVANNVLPLTSLLIEPAKVLFLNNAINHGVLTPLALDQVSKAGKSVLFLLEANPGPGLGVLLAYMFFGKGQAKASAPGAAIIHFFGGIHEIYFPYVLMKPALLAGTILGGMTGIFLNVLFGVGLVGPAAPGSIIAVYAMTARDSYLGVTIAVLGAIAVSFAVSALILRRSKDDDEGDDLSKATADMEAMKGKKSVASSALAGAGAVSSAGHQGPIKNIVFACDAGMGSSAMGASVLRRKVQAAGFKDVTVINKAIANLTDTFDLVVSHQDLTPRAKQKTGSAVHVSVENFMDSPRYDEIVDLLKTTNTGGGSAPAPVAAAPVAAAAAAAASDGGTVLEKKSIVLSGSARDREAAINEVGQLLVDAGAVDRAYVDAMHQREATVSTYMGNLLAIPHGTNDAKQYVKRSAIAVVRYPEGLDWKGKPVKFVIGVAGKNNEHLTLLGQIAGVFTDKAAVANLETANSEQEILDAFGKVHN